MRIRPLPVTHRRCLECKRNKSGVTSGYTRMEALHGKEVIPGFPRKTRVERVQLNEHGEFSS